MKREFQSADALEDDYTPENKVKTKKVNKIHKKKPKIYDFSTCNQLEIANLFNSFLFKTFAANPDLQKYSISGIYNFNK